MFAGQFAGYWRDGKRIVMDRNAVLPDRCIKCNEPANGFRRSENLTYVPTSQQLMLGVWSYVDAKRAPVEIGLCERHRASRPWTAALVSAAAVAFSILEVTQLRPSNVMLPILAAIAFIGGCIGLIYAFYPRGLVRATDMTASHLWLKGAGERFLASLPTAPAFDEALPILPETRAALGDPAIAAAGVFRNARSGAILFLAGCAIAAFVHALNPQGSVIAWGFAIFGLVRIVDGGRAYIALPAEHRTTGQVLTLAGLIGAGLLLGGWAAASVLANS